MRALISFRSRRQITGLSFILALCFWGQAQAGQTHYMSLDACQVIEASAPDEQGPPYARLACPGFGDVAFELVAGDAREWAIISRNGWNWDTYNEFASNTPCCFFGFGAKVIEFRYTDPDAPYAVIMRSNYTDQDSYQEGSVLLVFKLGQSRAESCYLGRTTDNQAARNMADAAPGLLCPD